MMLRKGRIDIPQGRMDRLGSIIMVGTETNSEDTRRTPLDMQRKSRKSAAEPGMDLVAKGVLISGTGQKCTSV